MNFEALRDRSVITLDRAALGFFLDQFEEAFTLVDDPEARDQFMRILTESVETEGSRVRVLATLRADFFDRPLSFEHIGSHVSEGHVTVIDRKSVV